MQRQVTIYQLNEQGLEYLERIQEGEIQPEERWYKIVWQTNLDQSVSDEDLIYKLTKLINLNTALPHPIEHGDVIAIGTRYYLVTPTKYIRLWQFSE